MCSSLSVLSLSACMPPPDLVNKVQCILERSVFSYCTVFHLKAWGYNHPVSASRTAGISQNNMDGRAFRPPQSVHRPLLLCNVLERKRAYLMGWSCCTLCFGTLVKNYTCYTVVKTADAYAKCMKIHMHACTYMHIKCVAFEFTLTKMKWSLLGMKQSHKKESKMFCSKLNCHDYMKNSPGGH